MKTFPWSAGTATCRAGGCTCHSVHTHQGHESAPLLHMGDDDEGPTPSCTGRQRRCVCALRRAHVCDEATSVLSRDLCSPDSIRIRSHASPLATPISKKKTTCYTKLGVDGQDCPGWQHKHWMLINNHMYIQTISVFSSFFCLSLYQSERVRHLTSKTVKLQNR
jgi:hypothetical protein